jgi:hypothetical protein
VPSVIQVQVLSINKLNGARSFAKLNLVRWPSATSINGSLQIDLAGSERVARSSTLASRTSAARIVIVAHARSDAAGQRLEEAKAINSSLSALGKCINARGTFLFASSALACAQCIASVRPSTCAQQTISHTCRTATPRSPFSSKTRSVRAPPRPGSQHRAPCDARRARGRRGQLEDAHDRASVAR